MPCSWRAASSRNARQDRERGSARGQMQDVSTVALSPTLGTVDRSRRWRKDEESKPTSGIHESAIQRAARPVLPAASRRAGEPATQLGD
jgi:hypothetical protein